MLCSKIRCCFILILLLTNHTFAEEAKLDYPQTRIADQVDTFHGVEVPDPYRWLEEDVRTSEEVSEWVDAQIELARTYLDAIPSREMFRDRLTKLWNYERYSSPEKIADKYLFFKNDGLQDQAVLYVSDNYTDEGQVLIDPNTWSEDGTVSLGTVIASEDGHYLAYSRKESGSDWSTIYVMEVESGETLKDKVEWTRWGNIVWNAANDGFFYTRYPEPEEGEQFQSSVVDPMIYFHQLGTDQSEDKLVYCRPDNPTWSFWLTQTEDNQIHILSIGKSTDPQNQVWFRMAKAPLGSPWLPLIEDFENEFAFVGNQGSKLYFLTDYDAPTKRLVAMDVSTPGRPHLEEVLPATEATLVGAAIMANDKLVAAYLKDVVSQVKIFDLEGKLIRDVELPGVGSVGGFDGKQKDTETFFSFTSYDTPTSIYRYDINTGETARIRKPGIDYNADDYEVRQAFYASKDGTRIPILVTHKKGLELNGQNPTLLYGYGGFNISLTPRFQVPYAVWMEQGGVVAVPNLRGGGEYGEAWHKAGKTLNKQNVFDDFIAAAEWLIAEGYTSSEKLAIKGGSNGGLLVGACMTQRPELYGACLPAVGVMDMLRYQNFTAGHFWRAEYGTVDDAEEFKAIYAYSPYHNIKKGVEYPATMVTTADTDDRVVPMHSFKFGAALQAAQAGPEPILLRIEKRAGHGAGTPISKLIDLAADNWAFLWKNLGMEE